MRNVSETAARERGSRRAFGTRTLQGSAGASPSRIVLEIASLRRRSTRRPNENANGLSDWDKPFALVARSDADQSFDAFW